jgi:hypothetical protein
MHRQYQDATGIPVHTKLIHQNRSKLVGFPKIEPHLSEFNSASEVQNQLHIPQMGHSTTLSLANHMKIYTHTHTQKSEPALEE